MPPFFDPNKADFLGMPGPDIAPPAPADGYRRAPSDGLFSSAGPADPDRFAHVARSITPPNPMGIPARRNRASMNIGDYRSGGDGLLGDGLIDELAAERQLEVEPRYMYEDEYMPTGSAGHASINPTRDLQGIYTDDYRRVPSMLNEALPGGIRPTARETMPPLSHGTYGNPLERTWMGHNDSMPEGAIDYVSASDAARWGTSEGPNLYPADMVTPEFVRRREADPSFSPVSYDSYTGERDGRLGGDGGHQFMAPGYRR